MGFSLKMCGLTGYVCDHSQKWQCLVFAPRFRALHLMGKFHCASFCLVFQTPLSGIFMHRRLVFDSLWLKFRDQGVWANSQRHPKSEIAKISTSAKMSHIHTPRALQTARASDS